METPASELDPEFLAMLRCPVSKARLVAVGARLIAADPQSRRAYRVEDGAIPVLAPDEGEVLPPAEWAELMRAAGEIVS